jgi:hypothetical protein
MKGYFTFSCLDFFIGIPCYWFYLGTANALKTTQRALNFFMLN